MKRLAYVVTDLQTWPVDQLIEAVRAELKPSYHVTPGGLRWSRSTDALREIAARLSDLPKCSEPHTADDLRRLVAEFEAYIADVNGWSRRRFDEFSDRFKTFGINDRMPDEMLRKARGMFPGGNV